MGAVLTDDGTQARGWVRAIDLGRSVSAFPPGRPRRRRTADLTYLTLSLVLGVGLFVQQLNEQWSRDVFVHIAAIREYSLEGLGATNPFIGGDTPDAYLTPFHLLAGTLHALTGGSMTTTLALVGLANLTLWLVALRSFVFLVTARPWAPTFALVFTLVAWGVGPWRWSGYLSLNSIGYGLPYPAVFSIGVGLLSIVAGVKYLRGGSPWNVAGLVFGASAAVLAHPLSAMWLAVTGAAFVVASAPRAPRARVVVIVAAGVVAALLSLAWPEFSLLDVMHRSERWEGGNQTQYRMLALRAVLAAPGLVVLWLRFRRNRLDPLVIAGVLLAVLYAGGVVLGQGMLGRSLPGLMLVLHVALADFAAALVALDVRLASRARRTALVLTAGLVVVGTIGVAPALVRAVPRGLLPASLADDERLASMTDQWEPLEGAIGEGAVVAAPDGLAAPVAAFGGHLVLPPWTAPSLRAEELPERIAARNEILADPESSAAQAARARYRVTHAVFRKRPPFADRVGAVVLETPDFVVVVLD